MSVPVGKRSENRLHVFQKAREMVRHTCVLLVNEKHYPAVYQPIAQHIVDCAWQVMEKSWRANQVFVGKGCNPNAVVRRRELQNECVELCESLLAQIEAFDCLCHRPRKKTAYWTSLVVDTVSLLRKWRDSDAVRAIAQRSVVSED